jgi:lactam utilization protein B
MDEAAAKFQANAVNGLIDGKQKQVAYLATQTALYIEPPEDNPMVDDKELMKLVCAAIINGLTGVFNCLH